ncbi:MAG: hypothetical protein IKC35_02790 [Clostridia bacterium]|nr:hypothetical protein [Clostridia bacterium]
MKKIISVVLVAIMLFALVGCNGRETQEKLAELEAKLQEQSSKIDDLEQEKDSLLGQITQLQGEVERLEEEKSALEDELEETLDNFEPVIGSFCNLQKAYDNGFLRVVDLQEIASYTYDKSPKMCDWLEMSIKETRLQELLESYPEATIDQIEIIAYIGEYNGCYVVIKEDDYTFYPDQINNATCEIGGVIFREHFSYRLEVFVID